MDPLQHTRNGHDSIRADIFAGPGVRGHARVRRVGSGGAHTAWAARAQLAPQRRAPLRLHGPHTRFL